MKGSDSAMPIWADFMREALNRHPEFNGDWTMPDSVRKAEIDSRNGKLIRELSNAEADSVKAQQTVLKKNPKANTNTQLSSETPETKDLYVTDVPPEFRRIELFVSGTVPNKVLLPSDEANLEPEETSEIPEASPTPFTTWENDQQKQKGNQNSASRNLETPPDFQRNITVMICPITGLRATSNCPNPTAQTFAESEKPKDFCTFHINPPK